MGTSFSPSPKTITFAGDRAGGGGTLDVALVDRMVAEGEVAVGEVEEEEEEAEELRCSRRKASAVPLLCAAGMSSRQNVRACVIAKVPEDIRFEGQFCRSSRFAVYHHQGQLI